MDPIHSTPHYDILQTADGAFVIRARSTAAHKVLHRILEETGAAPPRERGAGDSACRIPGNRPFRLVHLVERCDARMNVDEVRKMLGAG